MASYSSVDEYGGFDFSRALASDFGLGSSAITSNTSAAPSLPQQSNVSAFKMPLTPQLNALAIVPGSCPQCKGRKYNFTAYFHNTKYFSSSPHHLLSYIERSYVLKNQLQSLLVEWAMNPRRPIIEFADIAEPQIRAWERRVQYLVETVLEFATSKGLHQGVGARKTDTVLRWTGKMVTRLEDTVWERANFQVSQSEMVSLLFQFRKLWESVWVGLVEDERSQREMSRSS
ncbi:hypothetical protein G7Y89_g3555 [Cudoniella acicularis]|uniref:Uncharacterized protein n=1 Tax=Cudoniella acicularis TaxID=354080 RepID=A0A8H4RR49_9HELO|nr:hypothetical protein G7Y89_g3555 [Cudoniella acicularis]